MPIRYIVGKLEEQNVEVILNEIDTSTCSISKMFDFEPSLINGHDDVGSLKNPSSGVVSIEVDKNNPRKTIIHFRSPQICETEKEYLTLYKTTLDEIVILLFKINAHSIAFKPFISSQNRYLSSELMDYFSTKMISINENYDIDLVAVFNSNFLHAYERNNFCFIDSLKKDTERFFVNQHPFFKSKISMVPGDFDPNTTPHFNESITFNKQEIIEEESVSDDIEDGKMQFCKYMDFGQDVFNPEPSFQEAISHHMFRKDLKASDLWKKANIDRKLFSKITQGSHPSKKTAILIVLALQLELDDTLDLLRRAGYALSNSLKEDIIVIECIKRGLYSVYDVCELQLKYGVPTLF